MKRPFLEKPKSRLLGLAYYDPTAYENDDLDSRKAIATQRPQERRG